MHQANRREKYNIRTLPRSKEGKADSKRNINNVWQIKNSSQHKFLKKPQTL